ncbi:hypothetical protein PVL29_000812 [Vitis rotundifolia]|uniref:Aldehyde dehydrogenase domain-containing protein n=1 Tax=Vitis rotundifolia TaxID=103349 RepID=A0AA39E591_VITRO|nr:hypothetical protein PVL29_000812 [Vitis rotundifolia]
MDGITLITKIIVKQLNVNSGSGYEELNFNGKKRNAKENYFLMFGCRMNHVRPISSLLLFSTSNEWPSLSTPNKATDIQILIKKHRDDEEIKSNNESSVSIPGSSPIRGLTVPAEGPHQVQTLHEGIGVVGQIIPWNFPLLMYTWKIGPALACGNTVVLKTAEQTPLSALYVSKLFHEVAFTGSTKTGKAILQSAAMSNLKPVTLELGGKSPFIVCEDANVDEAVEVAHFALFFNQGQCCASCSRTFVHESVYEEFVEKAKARALRRAVGDPFKAGIEQGPQIDSKQFEKIMRYIRSGVESGATLESGGERFGNRGFFIKPPVFSNVKIFGPVQSILKYKDLDEVIRRTNASRYGCRRFQYKYISRHSFVNL